MLKRDAVGSRAEWMRMLYPDSNRSRSHARILGLVLLAIACLLGQPAAASDPGSIEVVKALVPASDPGRFDLQIDGNTEATNVGNAGGTGQILVDEGFTYTVGEIAGVGTDLADYTSSIECSILTPSQGPPAFVSCTNCTSLDVEVGPSQEILCTITNKRIREVPAAGPAQLGVLMLALALASCWALRRRSPLA